MVPLTNPPRPDPPFPSFTTSASCIFRCLCLSPSNASSLIHNVLVPQVEYTRLISLLFYFDIRFVLPQWSLFSFRALSILVNFRGTGGGYNYAFFLTQQNHTTTGHRSLRLLSDLRNVVHGVCRSCSGRVEWMSESSRDFQAEGDEIQVSGDPPTRKSAVT